MPFLTFDNFLLVSFVVPLTVFAAVPLSATFLTLGDVFINRKAFQDSSGLSGLSGLKEQGRRASESLTSVPEEDEEQDETLIALTSDSPPSASSVAVALKLFNDQGEEGFLKRDDDSEGGMHHPMRKGGYDIDDGRFDSFQSDFSKTYSTATSPGSTLPSHFRDQQSHPTVQSLFETFGSGFGSDSPLPPHLLHDEEEPEDTGTRTPSATHHAREHSSGSTASYSTTRSGRGASSSSPSASLSLIFPNQHRRPPFTPFQSLSLRRLHQPPPPIDLSTIFDPPSDDGGDSIDRSEVSTSESERDSQILMINNDPSSLDLSSFQPVETTQSSISSNPASRGGSAFTFRSPLDFHHLGEFQQAEEEEIGLITPRASPEVPISATLPPDVERDLTHNEKFGVIGERRGGKKKGRAESREHERFPSPPPSAQSSPLVLSSGDDSRLLPRSHASRDASSISSVSTTAVSSDADQHERDQFADFHVAGGGEGKDGLGLDLKDDEAKEAGRLRALGREAAARGASRTGLRKVDVEQRQREEGVGSKNLRAGLKVDRPISTISTSSTHGQLGSPQLPYFLPFSHSKPNLAPTSSSTDSDSGSAVSTLRLASPQDFSESSPDAPQPIPVVEPEKEELPLSQMFQHYQQETSSSSSADAAYSDTIEIDLTPSPFITKSEADKEAEKKKAKKQKQKAKEREKKKHAKSGDGKQAGRA